MTVLDGLRAVHEAALERNREGRTACDRVATPRVEPRRRDRREPFEHDSRTRQRPRPDTRRRQHLESAPGQKARPQRGRLGASVVVDS